eukprot:399142-Rhodomonas_salina.1
MLSAYAIHLRLHPCYLPRIIVYVYRAISRRLHFAICLHPHYAMRRTDLAYAAAPFPVQTSHPADPASVSSPIGGYRPKSPERMRDWC